MSSAIERDRRFHTRHTVRGKVAVHILSSLASPSEAQRSMQGTIHDMSQSGLGILIPEALPLADPVRCEIRLSRIPVSIPTVAHVRWVTNDPSGAGMRAGLQFLL